MTITSKITVSSKKNQTVSKSALKNTFLKKKNKIEIREERVKVHFSPI